MSSSLALGMKAVTTAEKALICLADMPNVSAGHLNALIGESATAEIVASGSVDGPPTPPAIFSRRYFSRLAALEGD